MKWDYPKGVIRVYDDGESIDRHTVYFSRRVMPANHGFHSLLGMNAAPFHPQGFGQHSEGKLGRHNGRRIRFADLPVDCQKAVARDLLESS